MLLPSGRWHEGPRSGLHLRRADRQVRGLPRAAERAGGGQDAPGPVGRGRGRAQGGSLQGTATTTTATLLVLPLLLQHTDICILSLRRSLLAYICM